MAQKKRYKSVLSDSERQDMVNQVLSAAQAWAHRLTERQLRLLESLSEDGPERFTYLMSLALTDCKDKAFTPAPKLYPELNERLERLRRQGHPVQELRGSRVDTSFLDHEHLLRFELPFDANIKEYLPAMLAYQEYFKSLENPQGIPAYFADEYGRGRTYPELAEEMNKAIIAWVNGETTHLDMQGLDRFLRRKGYSPGSDKFELYDEERLKRMVKYFWTKK